MKRRHFVGLLAAGAAALGLSRWTRLAPGPAARLEARAAAGAAVARPAHHDADGRFSNPWPTAYTREDGGFLRWQRERRSREMPPNPPPAALPRAQPQIAYPHATADELRITWVGHASFLIQAGGLNLLTDPHWSRRASPVQFAGPARFTEPGVEWDALPQIDAVLISHDHYDHLDDGTVRRLQRRFGDAVRWFAPLEYRDWFRGRGVRNLTELDWWQESSVEGPAGPVRIAALPCQHWTRRTFWDERQKLWASWGVWAPGGRAVYFGGDSGYFPDYPQIRERVGTFDALLLPIGAYDPRWFMKPVHMNPEEAVQTYRDLGGQGVMMGMHWGTWRLTDEDPLEPPLRTRAAWSAAGLPAERLWVPRHGETWIG
jgi:N-acyl-phosphatidylethanolamine-hydrolysing phospholipase D